MFLLLLPLLLQLLLLLLLMPPSLPLLLPLPLLLCSHFWLRPPPAMSIIQPGARVRSSLGAERLSMRPQILTLCVTG